MYCVPRFLVHFLFVPDSDLFLPVITVIKLVIQVPLFPSLFFSTRQSHCARGADYITPLGRFPIDDIRCPAFNWTREGNSTFGTNQPTKKTHTNNDPKGKKRKEKRKDGSGRKHGACRKHLHHTSDYQSGQSIPI